MPAVNTVQVADVAAAAARTGELGGRVIAYLTDPDGAMFALFSPRPEG